MIPALTVLENVTLPLELDSWRSRDSRRAGLDALASVGLMDRASNYPDDLSGGQQQRVAIARAIVGTRKLILADEPTGALDSHTGEVVLRMLRHRVDAGASAILVTHDARHAAWADRIVYLEDGRIIGQTSTGSPEELLEAGRE
ncbi:ABC transporter ATP-binding protein [Cryobacterium sp. Hb1]|uniref:ABC transporter ATP-binding protein n=1 Tax=Cryobacterium sp. Hb1 TaxID=1259147 RepID=UPI003519E417